MFVCVEVSGWRFFSILKCKNSLANNQIWANGFCRWLKSGPLLAYVIWTLSTVTTHVQSAIKTYTHSSRRRCHLRIVLLFLLKLRFKQELFVVVVVVCFGMFNIWHMSNGWQKWPRVFKWLWAVAFVCVKLCVCGSSVYATSLPLRCGESRTSRASSNSSKWASPIMVI